MEVPFVTIIPEADRDPDMKLKLCDPTARGPAVLTWLVEGALAWQRQGLNIPAAVRWATGTDRNEVDTVGAFLDDETERPSRLKVPTAKLYAKRLHRLPPVQGDAYAPLDRLKMGSEGRLER